MTWLHVKRSETPLILTFPHGGAQVPEELREQFVSLWLAQRDADWHIRELYEGLADATMIWTDISRSVVDCNRPPEDAPMYPGMVNTGLCPLETFDGDALYREGEGPDVELRRASWHAPFHAAVEAEIERLLQSHDRVVLYDCHSIRSRVPRLFDGELPALNVGTNNGASCAPELAAAVMGAIPHDDAVLNGRFRGGWITRNYGRPDRRVHAIQMEIAMRAYLDEPEGEPTEASWPPAYTHSRAADTRAILADILNAAQHFAEGSS